MSTYSSFAAFTYRYLLEILTVISGLKMFLPDAKVRCRKLSTVMAAFHLGLLLSLCFLYVLYVELLEQDHSGIEHLVSESDISDALLFDIGSEVLDG